MTKILFSALTASALAAAAVSFAPVAVAGETAALEYADLDLSSDAGKAELSKRIDVAARKACRTQPGTGTRIASNDGLDECMASVRKQVETRLATRGYGSSVGR
ncbi:MAG: UrcA family protein [Novosphingobium sp.]